MTNLLNEEEIIRSIWKNIATSGKKDPFDDDVAWVPNSSKKYIVAKSDMLVSSTDVPGQMTPLQVARKALISTLSDFAAKGIKPSYCLLSLGFPRKMARRKYLDEWAKGFASIEQEYGIKIIGGDTNATLVDYVIDCTLIGLSDKFVKRSGARPRELVGVSGSFGHQSAGLLMLLGRAKSKDSLFKEVAINSVLNPRARLDLGLRIARFLSSSIDSSDGLAISLYHLAESSRVNVLLDKIPVTPGVESFAKENKLKATDLALFGGEEFEIVCTFPREHARLLARLGIRTIGRVDRLSYSEKPAVFFDSEKVQRRGWFHFQN